MPAARKAGSTSLVDYLHSQAPTLSVSNTLPLSKYYRTLDLLLTQISAYRRAHNEEQLYVMLVRYSSMVIETIKQHKDFSPASPRYKAVEQHARLALAECEKLKIALLARDIRKPQAHTSYRPADTVRIEDASALPDIDWGSAGIGAVAAAAAPRLPPPEGSLELGADLEWPPRSASQRSSAAGQPSTSAPAAGAAAAGTAAAWAPVAYSSGHYMPSNQQLVAKHALFGPRGSSGSWGTPPGAASSGGSSGNARARYPAFDASPIDALWAAPAAAAAASAASSSGGAQQQQQPHDVGALSQQMAQLQHPSAGPSLGPQELEVQSMLPCQGQPGGTCAMPPPPPSQQQQQLALPGRESAAEAAAAAAAGPKGLSKRIDLRDVHISVALMNDFLHYSASNTRRGIESCGILAGRLSASDSRFTVTTLIVPKQTGTSDTVEMLGEEEVWEVESSRELVPLGWIHTHPTQTCFLSSVDIHTQCGYQTMLEEAVAIVMAPSDSRRKCGIFRLTTPEGLGHVQRCGLRGFHADCSSTHYELCGHVYLNPNAKHEVIDLRG